MSADVLAGLSAEELFGEIVGVFELADRRGAEPLAVRAFNPTLAGGRLRDARLRARDEHATTRRSWSTPSRPSSTPAASTVRQVIHPVIGVERDGDGRIATVLPRARERRARVGDALRDRAHAARADELTELVRPACAASSRDVQAAVRDFARDARSACRRWSRPRGRPRRATRPTRSRRPSRSSSWLLEDNFVFLGYREYAIDAGAGRRSCPAPGSASSPTEASSHYARAGAARSSIEPKLRERIAGGDLLLVSKTNRFSTVHRRARMDYVGVKRVGEDGAVARRAAPDRPVHVARPTPSRPSRVPILRRKLRQIVEAEDLFEGSHDYKAAVALYESFPKDELFGADRRDLRAEVMGLLHLQERRAGASCSCAATPTDRARLAARRAAARPLQRRAAARGCRSSSWHRFDGDVGRLPPLARRDRAGPHPLHRARAPARSPTCRSPSSSSEVVALTRTWDDRLRERLVAMHGEEHGVRARRALPRALPRLLQDLDRHLDGAASTSSSSSGSTAASRSSSRCRTSAAARRT